MNTLHVKYLLIGGGIASSAAAQEIRRRDRDGSALLVGQEINRPYRRDALRGGYLRRQVGHNELFTLPANWFDENDVELQTAVRAVQVDVARQSVSLSNGEEVAYDKLLIATGATAKLLNVPGANLPGVLYLRTIEQADTLIHTIEKARQEGRKHGRGRGRAAIVGSGTDATQLAQTLTELGIEVELVLENPQLWQGVAGDTTAKYVARELENNGVAVRGASVGRIEGDGRVQRVVLSDSSAIQCDFVVGSIGLSPNKELLRATPVRAEKAILTDEFCRTSAETIYAAGECAAVLDPRFGKYRAIASSRAAEITGRIAGANMAGGAERFDDLGGFTTRVFSLDVTAWGEPRMVDRRLVRSGENRFAEIGVDVLGLIAQVISIGPVEAGLEELVRQRIAIDRREESLKDPRSPLDI